MYLKYNVHQQKQTWIYWSDASDELQVCMRGMGGWLLAGVGGMSPEKAQLAKMKGKTENWLGKKCSQNSVLGKAKLKEKSFDDTSDQLVLRILKANNFWRIDSEFIFWC